MYNVYFNNIKLASKLVYKIDRIFVSWQSKKRKDLLTQKDLLNNLKE